MIDDGVSLGQSIFKVGLMSITSEDRDYNAFDFYIKVALKFVLKATKLIN